MLGDDAGNRERAARGRRGGQVGRRGDAVRNHAVLAPREFFDALDDHRAFPRAADSGAAGIQKIRQVADFRLARRVGDGGDALRADGGDDDVLGCAHARERKVDARPPDAVRDGTVQAAVVFRDDDPHLPQGRQMQVDGPGAELASAREGKHRFPHAADDGPQKDDGRAHLAHQMVRDIEVIRGDGVDADDPRAALHRAPEMPEDSDGRVHI